nr:TRAP transporter substrate-binding protein DctP [Synergistales bacterium]
MKRGIVLLTVFALCIVFGGVASGAEISLNLGHTSSTSHHYHTSSEKFAELVKERTNGKVEINIFPASQLGSLPDMTESTMLGTQDLVLTAGPILGNTIPEFQALYMPYIFRDYDHIGKFEKSEAARILGAKLEDRG